MEKGKKVTNAPTLTIVEQGPLRVTVKLEIAVTKNSKLVQFISLTGVSARIDFDCHVDWENETHTLLKVHFPTTVKSPVATFEVQYGHIQKNTHFNTSWDVAKFENCAQKV